MPVAKNGRTVLLAEDDLEVRGYLETALKCQGYSVTVAQDGEEALACFLGSPSPISAVVLDVIMPRMDGIDALKEIRRFNRSTPVIMISGSSSALNVVEAMKNGASNFLSKPIDPGDLRNALKEALGNGMLGPPANGEQAAPPKKQVFFGTSPQMAELQNLAGQIGWSEAPVLIHGETGVGKEVLARDLHSRSPRAKKPLLKLNCAALPSELVESELFGYERGAFTGAFQKKPGMFELADGGTILLDEIGDMDFKLQAKLLQVLQDQEFQRLGGKETIKVDVRVIAATHRDLERAISENTFREDLYYRISVITVRVPPLRERREDILAMADFLVRKHSAPASPPLPIPPSLKAVFLEYPWPGNIRELENMVRKLLVLRDARIVEQDLRQKHDRILAGNGKPVRIGPVLERIEAAAAPTNGTHHSEPEGPAPVLARVAQEKREAEESAILAALQASNWNRRRASALLQIDYKALLYKMKRLGIKKEKAPLAPMSGGGGESLEDSEPLRDRRLLAIQK
ncbi:MAG TPA: sigma-54 dependent transcriptional regulator [Bryobacteraceae bacterium]|nr:sigma-54 dependent transcriptional regulator [Bryobacteraceae bacterium]